MDKTVWQREFQDSKVFDMFNSSWWIDFPGLQWKEQNVDRQFFLNVQFCEESHVLEFKIADKEGADGKTFVIAKEKIQFIH